jgi:hypothetical protein
MRLFFVLWLASSATWACSCIGGDIDQQIAAASVIFRGVVKSVDQLPSRVDLQRPRFEVTFAVSEYWKANMGRRVSIRVLEPASDCIGAHFDSHTDYVVFAKSQYSDDYRMGNVFWYGWLDLMPKGTVFLTVNAACNLTSTVKHAGNTLRALGPGKKPAN